MQPIGTGILDTAAKTAAHKTRLCMQPLHSAAFNMYARAVKQCCSANYNAVSSSLCKFAAPLLYPHHALRSMLLLSPTYALE